MTATRTRRSRRAGHPGIAPGSRNAARPGPLGNPWRVGPGASPIECVDAFDRWLHGRTIPLLSTDPYLDHGARARRRARLLGLLPELAGVDLACWCHLDAPCHADVVLAAANPLPSTWWLITCGTLVMTSEAPTVTHAHLLAHATWPRRSYHVRPATPAEVDVVHDHQALTVSLTSTLPVDARRNLLAIANTGWTEPDLFDPAG